MVTKPAGLIGLDEALHMSSTRNVELNERFCNPRLTRMLKMIQADRPAVRAEGSFYWDRDGNRYLDFLAGFGSMSLGANHPRIQRAMAELDGLPPILQNLNHLAGALAHNLALLAPGDLKRVFFANSGTEVVEAAIKLSRAATRRKRIVACKGCFHGRTTGALALIANPLFREAFEPLLPDVSHVPYDDPEALEAALRKRDVAGFIVEPIQSEGGINVPSPGYLKTAGEICSRYGTLLVVDEVQTGLGRTGRMFAIERENVTPDVLLLGKALGGGAMPISAALCTQAVFQAGKSATPRTAFQTPTFGSNSRACGVALAALEILVDERLPERAEESGAYLMSRLQELKRRHALIADVRGKGLLIGIELASPARGVAAALTASALNRAARELMLGMVIMRMYTHHNVMTAFTLNRPDVLRLEPALNATREQMDMAVDAIDQTLTSLKGYAYGAFSSWRALRARHKTAAAG